MRRPPLATIHRDEQGVPTSMSFPVLPCAAEPRESFERRAEAYVPWQHGLATYVARNGCDEPLAFCDPCADAWIAETDRLARLRRLPPVHRTWLAARGIRDWPPREVTP